MFLREKGKKNSKVRLAFVCNAGIKYGSKDVSVLDLNPTMFLSIFRWYFDLIVFFNSI